MFAEWQKQKVIDHYLEHKDDSHYVEGYRTKFSLTKMADHSPEKLGFLISRDAISDILVEGGIRERDMSMARNVKASEDVIDEFTLLWNKLLSHNWRRHDRDSASSSTKYRCWQNT